MINFLLRIYLFTILLFSLASCQTGKEKLIKEIISGELKLFSDSIKNLNKGEANMVFLNYLKYVEVYPDDSVSADYLFKAADLAIGLQRFEESVSLFEKLQTRFPNYSKSPSALFMQAFIYETEIKDTEKAKTKYQEFLSKFPEHKLATSAQASLDQLNANMSDEDLIKLFEKKNNHPF